MVSRADLEARLNFHRTAKEAAQTAYIALLNGQVQSYSIGSRNLTKLDLGRLREEITYHQKEIDGLIEEMNGRKRRRAVGVIPRDW